MVSIRRLWGRLCSAPKNSPGVTRRWFLWAARHGHGTVSEISQVLY